jgi:hypothetical protein
MHASTHTKNGASPVFAAPQMPMQQMRAWVRELPLRRLRANTDINPASRDAARLFPSESLARLRLGALQRRILREIPNICARRRTRRLRMIATQSAQQSNNFHCTHLFGTRLNVDGACPLARACPSVPHPDWWDGL